MKHYNQRKLRTPPMDNSRGGETQNSRPVKIQHFTGLFSTGCRIPLCNPSVPVCRQPVQLSLNEVQFCLRTLARAGRISAAGIWRTATWSLYLQKPNTTAPNKDGHSNTRSSKRGGDKNIVRVRRTETNSDAYLTKKSWIFSVWHNSNLSDAAVQASQIWLCIRCYYRQQSSFCRFSPLRPYLFFME